MADRYWVGGTGNWNDTARWSTTSGGSSGASVPTASDNAYFDGASDTGGAFTVTVNVASTCNDLIIGDGVIVTALDQTMTLAGTSALTISGSLFVPAANLTRTYAGTITFNATTTGKTITTNGVSFGNTSFIFDGVNGEWTLGSSLTTIDDNGVGIRITNGSFNTGNYNITARRINSLSSTARTINLGSSTLTLSSSNAGGTFASIYIASNSNLTFNAGTSNLIVNSLDCPGLTFYNVEFGIDISIGTPCIITGANTFNNVTIRTPTSTIYTNIEIGANQTINGTFTAQSGNTSEIRRIRIRGQNSIIRTITANAVSFGKSIDFADITAAGASAPWDVSSLNGGDLKGNTNITFPAPKTVYWNLAGSQNWHATGWATTPTGTPALANFPLAQDTAVITESGAAGTISFINVGYSSTFIYSWSVGTLTFDDGVSPRTSAVTLNFSIGPTFYGDLKLSSGTIISGTSTTTFAGRNTQNITSAGKTFTNSIALDSPGGTLVLQDNLTTSTNQGFELVRGTLDLNGKVPSFGLLGSNYSNTRSITFGSSKIQISGNNATLVTMNTTTNFTYTGSGLVEFTYTGSTGTRGFQSQFIESNALSLTILGGSDTISFLNNNTLKNLNFGNFSGTFSAVPTAYSVYGNLTFSPTMTLTGSTGVFYFIASSGIQSLTTNGKTLDFQITKLDAGTLRLEDNLTMGLTKTFTHTQGTINLNGKILSTGAWSSLNNNIRNLTFGSGQILLQSTGAVWDIGSINLTIVPGTGKIVLANNTNTARSFTGAGVQTYPELEFAGDTGTATTTITGANRFARLTNSKQVAYTIVFPNAITSVDDWNLNGSDGKLITLSRTGGSGTFTINYTGNQYAVGRYLSISNSAATPASRMYAIFSTDGGSNTGWIFDAPKFGSFLNFFLPPL